VAGFILHALGIRRGLEFRYVGAARLVTPAAAAHPPMVHREYRIPSCPPPQSAYSKLPARSLSQNDWRPAIGAGTDAADSPWSRPAMHCGMRFSGGWWDFPHADRVKRRP